jgi:DNA-binding NarL/FixJ family response regulator
MPRIKILVADDHNLYVEGLTSILLSQRSVPINILRGVSNGNEVIEYLQEESYPNPDLILLDLNMPVRDGLSVLPEIKLNYPNIRVIALTMYDDAKFIKEVFNQGGDGYLLKTCGLDELLQAIREVSEGGSYIGNGLKVFPKKSNESTHASYDDTFIQKYNLTKREIEIILLISQAKSNKEIGEELFISDQTVGVHRKNMMRKLNVSSTAGLIKFAMDNFLL